MGEEKKVEISREEFKKATAKIMGEDPIRELFKIEPMLVMVFAMFACDLAIELGLFGSKEEYENGTKEDSSEQ